MLTDNDYFTVLNSVTNPVLVGSPVYTADNTVHDFKIEYINPVFSDITENKIKKGNLFSSFQQYVPSSINWYAMGVQTITENKKFASSFYSRRLKSWYHITMNKADGNLCVLTLTNITTMKSQERQLHYLAFHDSLTDLPNRAYFTRIFDATIRSTVENSTHMGIMLIDIDNMKTINDISGHSAGDEVLKVAAKILSSFEHTNIQPCRLGDDEFLVLATNIVSRNEMITISDAVFEAFQTIDINISAGVSLCPDDSTQANNLLRFADLAMHTVKRSGKNNIAFFAQTMYENFLDKELLQRKLIAATDNKTFQLYFQPQFDVKTNTLRGFEALLRWHDDTLGWINPENFIPIAEETHAILKLGQWVLDTAISVLKQWQQEYNFKGIMSVNVSPTQLKKTGFVFELFDLIKKYDIKPETLEIEITEGIFIDDMQHTVNILNHIRQMGVLISLDDFGTGYSSFRYLQCLPLTTLKIDKAFISNISRKSSVETDITDSIVSLVSKLGLETIAEGVERTDQLDILKHMNCRTIQGFLRGKPMERSRCEEILKQNSTVSA